MGSLTAPAQERPDLVLRTYEDVEQGSDSWHALRCGIVTASVVHHLVTPKTFKPAANDTSRTLTNLLVSERITGNVEDTYTSAEMERGKLDEPYARDAYSEHYAPVMQVGFMVQSGNGFNLGYSPDGLVGDDGLIEIKSRAPKKHLETILADEVPAENMAQCQAGLLVTGAEWLDYVSFCSGMPLWTKRVLPDQRWHEAIIESVLLFEKNAAAILARYYAAVEGLPTTERINHYLDMEF